MSRAAFATFSARPTSVWISTYAVTLIWTPAFRWWFAGKPSVPSAQTGFQSVELCGQLAREAVAESGEVLTDPGQLALPSFVVDREGGCDVGLAHVEPVEVEVLGAGHDADGGVGTRRVAVEAAADPLEHARVLTETGPQEFAVV